MSKYIIQRSYVKGEIQLSLLQYFFLRLHVINKKIHTDINFPRYLLANYVLKYFHEKCSEHLLPVFRNIMFRELKMTCYDVFVKALLCMKSFFQQMLSGHVPYNYQK